MTAIPKVLARATVSQLAVPAARTTTLTAAALDLGEYEGLGLVIQEVGTVSGTSPTLDGKITHCDTTGGSYTDVTGATFTQVTASNSLQTLVLDIDAVKQFMKYVATIGGTTPSFQHSAVFVGFKKHMS